MLNEFAPSIGQFIDAEWYSCDAETETCEKVGIKFKCKQLQKSGRGASGGQTTMRQDAVRGVMSAKGQFAVTTTADLQFKVGDRIILVGMNVDGTDLDKIIRDTSIDRSSINNIANLAFKSSAKYNSKILELR